MHCIVQGCQSGQQPSESSQCADAGPAVCLIVDFSCMLVPCSICSGQRQLKLCIACLQEGQAGLVPEAGLWLPAGGPCCRCWPPLPQVSQVRSVQCHDYKHVSGRPADELSRSLPSATMLFACLERLHSLCMFGLLALLTA